MTIRIREPSWLGCIIEGPDKNVRCSPQKGSAYDVPTQVDFRREIPGGDGSADIVLPRPEGDDGFFAADRARQWQFAPVTIFDEADRKVHKSRIVGANIGASEIVLETEGLVKSLEDDETARLLGIDRDLSNWEGMSVQRKLNWMAVPRSIRDAEVTSDDTTSAPSLETAFEDTATDLRQTEGWYDAEGLGIGAIDYAWKPSATVNTADTNNDWQVHLSSNDVLSVQDLTANLRAAGPGSGTLAATGATKKFAMVNFAYLAGPSGVTGRRFSIFWTQLAPIGDHGIPLRGTVGTGINDVRGLFVSDTVRYIVGRWGPLLKLTDRSIEPTSFAVPQVYFMDDSDTALGMIEGLALFGGNALFPLDWGVWGDEFWTASPGNYGRVWRARLDEGAEADDAGDDAHERMNGIKMTYDDGTGSQLSVGPPGSGATLETTALLDTSPTNPVNAGKAADRRWRSASMGVTSEPGATLAAQMVMAEANRKQWRGDYSFKGTIREQGGGEEPVYMIRPGDRGVVEDEPDVAERRIVNTAYTSADRTCKASIGARPNRQEVLYARAGIVLEGFLS